jgi:hypothetical protein
MGWGHANRQLLHFEDSLKSYFVLNGHRIKEAWNLDPNKDTSYTANSGRMKRYDSGIELRFKTLLAAYCTFYQNESLRFEFE